MENSAGVNNCYAPHFFAYNSGTDCCDLHECPDSSTVDIDSTSCCGDSVQCLDNLDNSTAASNCADARKPINEKIIIWNII